MICDIAWRGAYGVRHQLYRMYFGANQACVVNVLALPWITLSKIVTVVCSGGASSMLQGGASLDSSFAVLYVFKCCKGWKHWQTSTRKVSAKCQISDAVKVPSLDMFVHQKCSSGAKALQGLRIPAYVQPLSQLVLVADNSGYAKLLKTSCITKTSLSNEHFTQVASFIVKINLHFPGKSIQ